jgi:hypothetical protein
MIYKAYKVRIIWGETKISGMNYKLRITFQDF